MSSGLIDRRPFLYRMLVITGLCAIGVSVPLLDLYGRNPEVFVANRTGPGQIVLFALMVTVLPPLAAGLILAAAGLVGPRVSDVAYAAMVTVLALISGMVVGRQVVPDGIVGFALIALLVAAAIRGLHRWARAVLAFSVLALPVALILFAATSASARLIWGVEESEPVSGTDIERPVPVVLIQLDEFPLATAMERDGTINEALFPAFARLEAEGTWYRNAFSNSIATTQSVPAILTGKLGEDGLSPSAIDHPQNLFTLLGDDYEMHVIEWVAELCPEDTCPEYAGRAPARFSSLLKDVGVVYGHLTLPPGARNMLPSIDNSWKGFLGQNANVSGGDIEVPGLPVPPGPVRVDWADWMQRIINGIGVGDTPILHYAHLKAPHVPWVTNPSGTHYDRPEEYTEVEGVEGDGRWGDDEGPAILGYQRYLYQLGFLDVMFGRLWDRLDETGTWDDTLIIVIADHGASFVPGEHRRWPYADNRDDLYRIPLFVKYPKQTEGETVDEPAFGFDVLPTIVDVLGVSTDWAFDGISLRDVEGTDRDHEPLRWCCNGSGVSTDVGVLFDQVARNFTWIPDQSDWLSVAGVGPDAGLIGMQFESLQPEKVEGLKWSLDTPLDQVDRSSGIVQTLLTGRIELPPSGAGDQVVVVANDRVAGLGFITRDSETGGTFRSLIAEEALNDGSNDIELLVSGGDGRWLMGETEDLTVVLSTDDGRVLELRDEGSRRLQVESARITGDSLNVEGWAADVVRKVPPDTFYVFVGTELVAWGAPNVENGNVVRWFDSDDLLQSGFSFEIPVTLVPASVDQLTVVAEFGSYPIGDAVRIERDD